MRFLAVLATTLALGAFSAQAADDPALSIEANQAFLAANAKKPGVHIGPNGLQYKILQNGFGDRPALTDNVEVYYTGSLINGKIFDGTSPGLPAAFAVNQVVPGWTEVLTMMRAGDHWQLVLPPNLGYGARGAGALVPPNQDLIFDLTLVSTAHAPKRGDPGYVPDPNDPEDNPNQ